jgi:hypothetical protein
LDWGANKLVDEVQVRWPDGRITLLEKVEANQTLQLRWEEAQEVSDGFVFFEEPSDQIFTKLSSDEILNYVHKENQFVDFDRDRLTYHKLSTEGPKAIWGRCQWRRIGGCVHRWGQRIFRTAIFTRIQRGVLGFLHRKIFRLTAFRKTPMGYFMILMEMGIWIYM